MRKSIPTILFMVVAALAIASPSPILAASVQVTYTQGSVFKGPSQQGPWEPLRPGEAVAPVSFVRTSTDGIVELTLGDASVVRLAPDSVYEISEAFFGADQPRRYSAKLFFGKLWAKVQKFSGGLMGRFDNRIPTAVVGVRGTVYNLQAAADGSAEVYVYDGLVGVAPPVLNPGAAREEIAWPTEVSEAQWKEIILAKLQRLRIGADGRPGKPEAFDPQTVRDDWVAFNQERDARRP